MTSRHPVSPPAVSSDTTRRVARSAGVRLLAELVGKVATTVMIVVAARALGEAGFGVFTFALAVSLLLATLPAGGFATLLVQRASARPEVLDKVLAQVLAVNTAIALPVFVLIGGVVALLRPTREGALSVVLLLLAALLETWSGTLRSAAQVHLRQGGVAVALIAQRVGSAALACTVLGLGGGVVGLSAAYLVGTAIGVLGVTASVRRLGVGVDVRGLRLADCLQLARDAWPITVDAVVSTALFRLDVVLLGALAGVAAVGQYSAAYRLLETVLFLTWTLNSALFPAVSSAPSAERVLHGLSRGVAVTALVYVPFAVVLLVRPEDVLRLVYGGEYADGQAVLRWLAVAPVVFALGYFASYAMLARERSRVVLVASSLATAANVVANLALIPVLGATGAAAATTGCYALKAAILLGALRRDVGLRVWAVLRTLLVPVLACVPLLVVLLRPLPLLLAVALGAVVYGLTWLVAARRLEPESLAVLRQLVRRG